MKEKKKQDLLRQVPMRKLVASIKRDVKWDIRPSALASKPNKEK